MITLHDALIDYCQEHEIEPPSQKHSKIIGSMVIAEWKRIHKEFVPIEKTSYSVPVEVNAYPDDLAPNLLEVLQEYFSNQQVFISEFQKAKDKWFKKMNFDVDKDLQQVFEESIAEGPFEFSLNGINKNKAQYKICYRNPADLITLGAIFRSKLDNYRESNAAPAIKKERKRIPARTNLAFSVKK